MIQTAIETGLRWGELIALRPRHLNLDAGRLTIDEAIVEIPRRASPTGERMLVKPYAAPPQRRPIRSDHAGNGSRPDRFLGSRSTGTADRSGGCRCRFRLRLFPVPC
jgi:integrase